jgi:hypothetical protein
MASINTAINWFSQRAGKVTYSMTSRNGPSSYDCSSAVYHALIEAGYLPSTQVIGNTDSEFGNLETNGWAKLKSNAQGNFDTKRGDIFIWGARGASSGVFGHTGIFVDANNIIHCSGGYNGIHTDNYDWLRSINGYPTQTFYRYTGKSTPAPVSSKATDQSLEVGSYIKFSDTFSVDDVKLIGGIWQVRTKVLCRAGFTWDDNGIPAGPLVEVGADGYKTKDQSLDIGSLYKIPGKYKVLDLGYSNGMWLAQLEASGVKFWVDVATATEIPSNGSGTPTPATAPAPKPTTPPKNPVEPKQPTVPVNDPTIPPVVKPEEPVADEPEKPVETPVVTPPTEVPTEPVTNKNILAVFLNALVKFFKDLFASLNKK